MHQKPENQPVTTNSDLGVRALRSGAGDEVGHGVDGRRLGSLWEEVGSQISGVIDTLHSEVVAVAGVQAILQDRSNAGSLLEVR